MSIGQILIGNLNISRLIIGGNPFSGISHLKKDLEFQSYFTTDRIKKTLFEAESLGITTFFGRADNHIIRVLREYWDEGGKIIWVAQQAPEIGSFESGLHKAVNSGASAFYIHGGIMDSLVLNSRFETAHQYIDMIRKAGVPAGTAGHSPKVFEWADKNLDNDFFMGCYYNPGDRSKQPGYNPDTDEIYIPEDRDIKAKILPNLSKPVIHYKIFAAGRNDPDEAFSYASKIVRPQDGICIGVYTKDNPDMLKEDAALFEKYII